MFGLFCSHKWVEKSRSVYKLYCGNKDITITYVCEKCLKQKTVTIYE